MLLYCGKAGLVHRSRVFSIKGRPISAKVGKTTSVLPDSLSQRAMRYDSLRALILSLIN
jgi:hypothetical protein